MKQRRLARSCMTVVLLSAVGCGTEGTGPGTTDPGNDFFISGQGLRQIWSTEFPRVGLGGYQLTDISLTSDGALHTVYSYGLGGVNGATAQSTSFRAKIRVASGDTVATSGIPASLSNTDLGTITVPCRNFGLVPYTDVLAYQSTGAISGTPNWQSISGASGFAAIYADRSFACVTTYTGTDGLLHTVAQYAVSGVAQPRGDKVLTPRTLAASMEISSAGVPLTFVMDGSDSLVVVNYATGARLAGVRLPMISQYIPANALPNYRPDVYVVTKRNRAGTKVIGIVNNGAARVVSTFVYDIATNAIVARVSNVPLLQVNLYLGPNVTVDDDGNVYYFTGLSQTQINRITPAGGDVTYRSGFIGGFRPGQLIALKHIDDRLFVAIQTPGNSQYSDARGRGRLMLAVVE